MADVQFEDPYAYAQVPVGYTTAGPKGISGLLIRFGLAQDKKQANIILVIVMFVCFSLSVFVFPNDPRFDPEELPDPLAGEYATINQ